MLELVKTSFIGLFRTLHIDQRFKKPPRGTVVIVPMYHHVSSGRAETQFERGIPADIFEAQLRLLKSFAAPLRVENLQDCLQEDLNPGYYFLPTFDDAFADAYWNAGPIMMKLDIQGIMFIPTGFVDRTVYPWEHAERRRVMRETGSDQRAASVIAGLWGLPEAERQARLDAFPSDDGIFDLFATWNEIDLWQDTFVPGAHTVSHPRLDQCDDARVEEECVGSARAIEAHTGVAPRTFAPPFGISSAASASIESRHFDVRFGDENGVNLAGKSHRLLKRIGPRPDAVNNDYLLPRISWYCVREGCY